ncbi:MAG: DUF6134 family protein [Bacteroidota bacterium]
MKSIFVRFALIWGILILGLNVHVNAQETRTYKISALGKGIGTMQISRTDSGTKRMYHTISKMEVNLLFKEIRISIENRTWYEGNQMIKATNKVIANGKVNSTSLIEWVGNQYVITVDGETKDPIKSPVYHSGSMLYFAQPTGVSQSFAESSGLFMELDDLGEGLYQATDPHNGRHITYAYEGGKVNEVQIKHRLLTVKMREVE